MPDWIFVMRQNRQNLFLNQFDRLQPSFYRDSRRLSVYIPSSNSKSQISGTFRSRDPAVIGNRQRDFYEIANAEVQDGRVHVLSGLLLKNLILRFAGLGFGTASEI
jgi:hypothetical protein